MPAEARGDGACVWGACGSLGVSGYQGPLPRYSAQCSVALSGQSLGPAKWWHWGPQLRWVVLGTGPLQASELSWLVTWWQRVGEGRRPFTTGMHSRATQGGLGGRAAAQCPCCAGPGAGLVRPAGSLTLPLRARRVPSLPTRMQMQPWISIRLEVPVGEEVGQAGASPRPPCVFLLELCL